MNKMNECSHPTRTKKILITPIRGSKKYLLCHSFSLRIKLTQKIQISQSLQNNITYAKLTHTPTENPSNNVHGNQQNIYDRNIQREEL